MVGVRNVTGTHRFWAGPGKTNLIQEMSNDLLVAAGSTLTVTRDLHNRKIILLDTAAGSVCTLPAATGTGATFTFIVSVNPTSNSHKVQCVGTDEFAGMLLRVDTDTGDALVAVPAQAADNFDTITLLADQTTGGDVGDWIEIVDIATGVWAVRGQLNASGSVATPFSAAV